MLITKMKQKNKLQQLLISQIMETRSFIEKFYAKLKKNLINLDYYTETEIL